MSGDLILQCRSSRTSAVDGPSDRKERTMKKTLHACLIAGVALALPLSASAQSTDSSYCSALANKYAGFLVATNQQHQDPQAISARAGAEQCRAGNTAVGIPLLESSLRNAGIDLPPREAPRLIRVTHGHAKGG
jgi:hypothetical protein